MTETTENGIQITKLASGPADGVQPTTRDRVNVHYEGKLEDGTVFDSSYARGEPVEFPLGNLISGWQEVLVMMRPGDKWEAVIPPEMGYGSAGAGDVIPPDATLYFTIELLGVTQAPPPKESNAEAWATHTPWNSDSEAVRKTGSGVEYVVIASGDAAGATVQPTDQVVVYYEGKLTDGTTFDSAYSRGQPAVFPANRLIPGFVEALSKMRPGDHWLVYIPANLGYGAAGAGATIPPNADLIFEIEIIDVLSQG